MVLNIYPVSAAPTVMVLNIYPVSAVPTCSNGAQHLPREYCQGLGTAPSVADPINTSDVSLHPSGASHYSKGFNNLMKHHQSFGHG